MRNRGSRLKQAGNYVWDGGECGVVRDQLCLSPGLEPDGLFMMRWRYEK